jgi:MFS superfamily sulfate permease-like transporter
VKRPWPDLIAGLSIAGLVLPEAVAYAGIAGLPPLSGLLAAAAGLVTYGFLGGSRFAIVAATSSSAAVLAAALRSLSGISGSQALAAAAAIVMMAGLLFLAAGALRLGRVARVIARPVVRGLALALAVVISARQIARLCGIQATHTALAPLFAEIVRRHAEWQQSSLLLGGAALLVLGLLRRWPRFPGTLAVITLGIAALPLLGPGGEEVRLVGPIELSALRVQLPGLSLQEWLRAMELAVALMLVLFAESYGSIRASALRHGDAVNVNRELLALGAANLVSGFLQGMPVGAGYSATAAHESLGARSRLSGLVAAGCVVAALGLLLPWVERMPEPVLAAIVIFAMRHALTLEPLRPYLKWKRDRALVAVAIAAVLLLGVLDGLLVAIGVSLALLIREFTQPRVSVLGRLAGSHDFVSLGFHPDVRLVPQLLILRPEEPLFFANAEAVLEEAAARVAAAPAARALVLSLEESPNLDGTAIEALGEFASGLLRQGLNLRLARLKDPVFAVLTAAALPGLTGAALSGASVDAVVRGLTGPSA